eukprot:10048553-Ditylum_brightwellii.AAC.1
MVWTEDDPEEAADNDDADFLATTLHTMIVKFWEGKFDFRSWESGILAPVPKKGDLSNPNKWRP